MFTSFRIFSLMTEPGSYAVKRTRADFKWLAEKLAAEFPERQLPQIDKGDLNKKIIEEYFATLLNKEKLTTSRYLNYFLTADDRMFEERKNSEDNFIGNLMGKLKRPGVTLDELGITDSKRVKVPKIHQDFKYERNK